MKKFTIAGVALVAALAFFATTYPAARNAHGTSLDSALGLPGSAIPLWAHLMGGSDGTNLQPLKTDTAGRQIMVGAAADGAALAGNPLVEGLGFNGVVLTPRYCDKQIAFTTQSTTAIVKQIAEVASQHIYVCGWILHASTATTGTGLTWYAGSGAACGGGSNAAVGGPFIGTTPTAAPSTPNSVYGPSNPALRMTIAAGDALCTKQTSATNATTLSGTIFYTQD